MMICTIVYFVILFVVPYWLRNLMTSRASIYKIVGQATCCNMLIYMFLSCVDNHACISSLVLPHFARWQNAAVIRHAGVLSDWIPCRRHSNKYTTWLYLHLLFTPTYFFSAFSGVPKRKKPNMMLSRHIVVLFVCIFCSFVTISNSVSKKPQDGYGDGVTSGSPPAACQYSCTPQQPQQPPPPRGGSSIYAAPPPPCPPVAPIMCCQNAPPTPPTPYGYPNTYGNYTESYGFSSTPSFGMMLLVPFVFVLGVWWYFGCSWGVQVCVLSSFYLFSFI